MILTNIRDKQKDRGFTIVELLVVIVVIGILAAITIVSYAGITARANGAKAVANAQTIQSIAETINADVGVYPTTVAGFNTLSTITHLPSGITLGAITNVTAALGTTNFSWYFITGATTGGKIVYWDYTAGTATGIIYCGVATSGSSFTIAT